jgi:hypothetical protein
MVSSQTNRIRTNSWHWGWRFCSPLKGTFTQMKWRSVVEWLGHSAQDQRVPDSSPGHTRSLYLHMCSPVPIDWFIKGRVVCGLPVIHAPERPLGIIRKEKGNLPSPSCACTSRTCAIVRHIINEQRDPRIRDGCIHNQARIMSLGGSNWLKNRCVC